MKILVSFISSRNKEDFQGTRLRKSIKGSLELSGIKYTSSHIDYYDVAHFISVKDENRINESLENNDKVVVSCLGTEGDKTTSYLDVKIDKKGKKIISLLPKIIKVLNKVHLILVPNEISKEFLIKEGVTTKISVVPTGVNLSRFDFSREDEKEIFYRYYREDKTKKLIVATGHYDSLSGISAYVAAAKKNPDAIFYYFAPDTKKLSFKTRRLIKNAPKNLKFKSIPSDDIYRSALINASLYVYTGYGVLGVVSLLEAMAARCQIIIREQPMFEDIFKDQDNVYVYKYSETLTSFIKDFLEEKVESTIENAYKYVQTVTIDKVGELLKNSYESLLK
jgi:1,2-diacylglycerol-3-alpha-glucose alpha-1,2-glucosyltransferase